MDKAISCDLEGKWVVMLNEHIIISGDDVKSIVEEAKRKYPNKKLTLAKVPTKESMIY